MKLGRILGMTVALLLAAQTAKAEFFYYDLFDDPGMILKAFSSDIPIADETTTADLATVAGPSSNPATNIPGVGKSNWVFQFDLTDLYGAEPVLFAEFTVGVEGNDDPDLLFGIGHGGATGMIDVGSFMSPSPLETHFVDIYDSSFFALDVTAGLVAALDAGDDYYRVALSANPDISEGFTSASFYFPELVVETVPEPSTLALFGVGAMLVGLIRLRKRK